MDIRYLQIFTMLVLLAFGAWYRDFSINTEQVVLSFLGCLSAQFICVRWLRLRHVGFLSAVITSIGLSLLLRSENSWVHLFCGFLCIFAKFSLRFREKHLFNPAMLGVLIGLVLFPGTWVSAGQWGSDIAIACWFLAIGSVLTVRARSFVSSWSFVGVYAFLWYGHRVLWLGYEMANFFHQFASGALLLFAFFMISDPKTSPNSTLGKVVHATFVAIVAYLWQYGWYEQNGLVWALFLSTPLVPLLDVLYPAKQFNWKPIGDHQHAQMANSLSHTSEYTPA